MDFPEAPPAVSEPMTQRTDDALISLQRQILER
jgi:hypothetical protein